MLVLNFDDPDFDWNQYIKQNCKNNNEHTNNCHTSKNPTIVSIPDDESDSICDDKDGEWDEEYKPNLKKNKDTSTPTRTSKRQKSVTTFYSGTTGYGSKNKFKNEVKKVTDVGRVVGEWVKKYFIQSQSENWAFLPPLYFQHDGHSRTIIGAFRKYNLYATYNDYNKILYSKGMRNAWINLIY